MYGCDEWCLIMFIWYVGACSYRFYVFCTSCALVVGWRDSGWDDVGGAIRMDRYMYVYVQCYYLEKVHVGCDVFCNYVADALR